MEPELTDPDFSTMDVGELEAFIQNNGRKVEQLRRQNTRAHAVLEPLEDHHRRRAIAARGVDFPAAQVVRMERNLEGLGDADLLALQEQVARLLEERKGK